MCVRTADLLSNVWLHLAFCIGMAFAVGVWQGNNCIDNSRAMWHVLLDKHQSKSFGGDMCKLV